MARETARWRRAALQLYRLAMLVVIAWIIRDHHLRLRLGGLAPVTVEEVRVIYPTAARLDADAGERSGWFVKDAHGADLGYVLRTAPVSDSIIGYRGWTDTLVAFDPALRVLGVRIRSSQDTRDHVQDVRDDRYFMKLWNGKSWDEIARITPEQAGIEGVSGASMTSMAMAEGIMRRLRAADAALSIQPTPLRFASRDIGLIVVIGIALVLAFHGVQGSPWLRRGFQISVIVYVGIINGDLLAQSLIVGWTQSGAVPWRTAPGLVLLLAAALAIPWAARKPVYCHHICPHGAAQMLLNRVAPKRWRINLPADFARGLRWLPALLLGTVVIISMLVLPIDLAHLEPFDAYVIRTAGWATIAIAVAGLVASLFVPMAYCHYGCPTGALLEFVRGHGSTDRFGRRDITALLLVALSAVLSWKYAALHAWIVGQ